MEYYMSKHANLLSNLQAGKSFTAKQITGYFGLKSPSRAVNYLREQGHCVYANKAVLSDGSETVKYRIGKPSKRMVSLAAAAAGASAFTR